MAWPPRQLKGVARPARSRGVGIIIVIEMDPGTFGAASLDFVGPFVEFIVRVIVTIQRSGPCRRTYTSAAVWMRSSGSLGRYMSRR